VLRALELTRQAKANLLSARRRVDDMGFEDELEILDNYFVTLGACAEPTDSDLSEISDDESLAISHPTRTTIDHLSNLFHEIAVHLTDPGMSLMDTGRIENELSILGIGYDDLRDTMKTLGAASRLGADAIVTGNLLEMTESFALFARVTEDSTEEVLAAAQVVMDGFNAVRWSRIVTSTPACRAMSA
jgi:hypothetical protein